MRRVRLVVGHVPADDAVPDGAAHGRVARGRLESLQDGHVVRLHVAAAHLPLQHGAGLRGTLHVACETEGENTVAACNGR